MFTSKNNKKQTLLRPRTENEKISWSAKNRKYILEKIKKNETNL